MNMNMEELYQEMKKALVYFGLSFHQMALVEVAIEDKSIVFSYNGRLIVVPLK